MPHADPEVRKAYRKEYHKRWYAANREKKLAQNRQRDAENPDKAKARFKNWAAANRDKRNESSRAWVRRNPEKRKAVVNAWRGENRERYLAIKRKSAKLNYATTYARIREWQRAHPEVVEQYRAKRRAQKAGASTSDVQAIMDWTRLWRQKSKVRCFWCNEDFTPRECTVDHIVALHIGGTHSPDNLCIACRPCNCSKQAKAISEWNAQIASPVLL